MIRADLHCHTCHSHDSFAAVDAVLEQASRRGLTHMAITDHDEIEGALRAREKSLGMAVIVGTEISLRGGAHLIGLFLERKIASRTLPEAIDEIRAQQGFVVLPHPFNPISGLLREGIDEELLRKVDAVEVCNGYEPTERNESAARLARECGLAALAGSDAHYAVDVGRACVEFPEVSGELTTEVLRRAARKLFGPAQDLTALHAADSAFRANTAPRVRKLLPKTLRNCAKKVNWLRVQRQIERQSHEPVRKEFPG
ncbi:MAG TPA: PHP-associated domain-containing protein [Verrucomicrobiae bacterium]|nr:PHP-associated domain-containing protein [Verrucomicrobiae bacterium]